MLRWMRQQPRRLPSWRCGARHELHSPLGCRSRLITAASTLRPLSIDACWMLAVASGALDRTEKSLAARGRGGGGCACMCRGRAVSASNGAARHANNEAQCNSKGSGPGGGQPTCDGGALPCGPPDLRKRPLADDLVQNDVAGRDCRGRCSGTGGRRAAAGWLRIAPAAAGLARARCRCAGSQQPQCAGSPTHCRQSLAIQLPQRPAGWTGCRPQRAPDPTQTGWWGRPWRPAARPPRCRCQQHRQSRPCRWRCWPRWRCPPHARRGRQRWPWPLPLPPPCAGA